MKKSEKTLRLIIGVLFLLLYMLVATISAICSIDFFMLSHNMSMAICLAIAFELGAMCSLCAGVFMKSNRTLSFSLFILLTLFQMMGNVFHSYTNLMPDFTAWIELFNLIDLEIIAQKRIVSIVSGAILPIVALGFIKCFVDYNDKNNLNDENVESVVEKPATIEQKIEPKPEPKIEKINDYKAKETPKMENNQAEKPKVEQKPVEKPKVEQKPVEKPKTVERPKVEQKTIEKPKVDEKQQRKGLSNADGMATLI